MTPSHSTHWELSNDMNFISIRPLAWNLCPFKVIPMNSFHINMKFPRGIHMALPCHLEYLSITWNTYVASTWQYPCTHGPYNLILAHGSHTIRPFHATQWFPLYPILGDIWVCMVFKHRKTSQTHKPPDFHISKECPTLTHLIHHVDPTSYISYILRNFISC